MSDKKYYESAGRRNSYAKSSGVKVNWWLLIGAAVLIVLLILWLTVADLSGNTDVAALIPVM